MCIEIVQARFGGRRWDVLAKGVLRLPYRDTVFRWLGERRSAARGRIEPGAASAAFARNIFGKIVFSGSGWALREILQQRLDPSANA